jgi:hypothetical protein
VTALCYYAILEIGESVMAVKDLTQVYIDHRGQWVALKGDGVSVITAGAKLKDVMDKAKKMGYKKPLMTKVPKHNYAHVGLRARRA